ncbi:MAG TPA: preprotein translocase subunit SecE [Ktedonobacteraceae bacterium]|nr:preprotein translocase subunit SecE [Ktedonobacteraceae bacterium]
MANKMAEKKKNAGPSSSRNQATEAAKARSSEKEQPVRSNKPVARDDRKDQVTKQENRSVRREAKGPSSWETRFRTSRFGRFVLDAYYELRHKVTWPTFEEARNMTLVVIALSAVIGALLSLADVGLQQLFLLISGR